MWGYGQKRADKRGPTDKSGNSRSLTRPQKTRPGFGMTGMLFPKLNRPGSGHVHSMSKAERSYFLGRDSGGTKPDKR
jgi:hypothetical protein